MAYPAKAETPTTVTVDEKPKTEQEIIAEYFKDIPILIDVQRCESINGQFYDDGTVVTGKVDPRDTGAMQINTHYHLATAKKLGLDIFTLKGNLIYARYLYETQGTKPWSASKGCWGQYRTVNI